MHDRTNGMVSVQITCCKALRATNHYVSVTDESLNGSNVCSDSQSSVSSGLSVRRRRARGISVDVVNGRT